MARAFIFLEPGEQFEVRLMDIVSDAEQRPQEVPAGRARVIGVDRYVRPVVPMVEILEPNSRITSTRSMHMHYIWKEDRARVQALLDRFPRTVD